MVSDCFNTSLHSNIVLLNSPECIGMSAYFDTTLLDPRIVSTWLALYVVLHLLTMAIHEGHLLTYYSSWTSPLHTRVIVAKFIPVERIQHQSDQTQRLPTGTLKVEDTESYEPGMLVHVQREQYYRRTPCAFQLRAAKVTAVTSAKKDHPAKRIVVEGSKFYMEHVNVNILQAIFFFFFDPFCARLTGSWPFSHYYHPAFGWTRVPFGNRYAFYPKTFADESKGALEESQGSNDDLIQRGQELTIVEVPEKQLSIAQQVFAVLDTELVPPNSSMGENYARLSFPELFDHANGASYPSRVHLSGADRETHMGEYEHMPDMKGPSPVYKRKTANGTSTSGSCLFAHSARWYVAEITEGDLERAKSDHHKLFLSATIVLKSKQAPRRWLLRRVMCLPVGDNQDWKTGSGDDVPCFRVSANIRIETRHSVDIPFESHFQLDFPAEYLANGMPKYTLDFRRTKATISFVSGSYEYKEDMRMFPSPEPTRVDNWFKLVRCVSYDNPKYLQRKRCSVKTGVGGTADVHWCTCTSCAQLETVAIVSGTHKFRTGTIQGGSLHGTNSYSLMVYFLDIY
jgi:hypothetical protein